MPNTLGLASYGPQDEFSASTADGVSVIEGGDSRTDSSASYPSPASTISPGGGSPHTQDGQPATTPPSTVPISRTSELAFALQSRPDQAQTMHSSIPSQEHLQSSNYSQSTHQDSPSDSGLSTGVPESSTSTFYYPHQADHGDQRNVDASVPNADFNPNYGAECDSNVFSAGHFGPAGYDSVGNSYPIDGPGDHSLQPHHHQQHHQQQHPQLEYPQVCSMPDIYAPYSDSMVSSIDNTISGMDSYISYN
ncbi:hypothetical protein BDQ17DRAFT_1419855 [Cyathus striatus]|nr:hypothetical protein BDQ17DRAFT_1419855 [Cyathus striatus]